MTDKMDFMTIGANPGKTRSAGGAQDDPLNGSEKVRGHRPLRDASLTGYA
jgi:hypothetical protein